LNNLSIEDIVELQSTGIQIGEPIEIQRGGAGPSDAVAIRVGSYTFMAPSINRETAYALEPLEEGFSLRRNGEHICGAETVGVPRFYSGQTRDGIPFRKIALLHGSDCLASTVVQTCIRWNSAERCRFCGIGLSLATGNTIPVKRPEHLAEAAEAAVRLDGIKHIVLTTGTTNYRDKGTIYLAECSRAIAEAVEVPIQVQCEPPDDLGLLGLLRDSGVDSIGIHLESFDQNVREKVTPGKASVSLDYYDRTFGQAVKVFGANQVSTFVIAGLGEPADSIIEGCKRLIDAGVYPFVLPLRPIPGSDMESACAPSVKTMMHIYAGVSSALKARGLSWQRSTAGCVRCGACSALPAFERLSGVEQ